jgi:biotin carboxyl carrier protein
MAYVVELGQQTHRIDVHPAGDSLFTIDIDGVPRTVDSRRIGHTTYSLLLDGRSIVAEVSADGEQFTVSIAGEVFRLRLVDERKRQVTLGQPEEEKGRREIRASMPGKVVEVLVEVGDVIQRDQGVVIVEAMKMENELKSPAAGEVKEVFVKSGQTVETNQVLVVVEA